MVHAAHTLVSSLMSEDNGASPKGDCSANPVCLWCFPVTFRTHRGRGLENRGSPIPLYPPLCVILSPGVSCHLDHVTCLDQRSTSHFRSSKRQSVLSLFSCLGLSCVRTAGRQWDQPFQRKFSNKRTHGAANGLSKQPGDADDYKPLGFSGVVCYHSKAGWYS